MERLKGLHTLWGAREGAAAEKDPCLRTCSANQAHPPCVMARRLTRAHPWVTNVQKKSPCWCWDRAVPALSSRITFSLTQTVLVLLAIPPLPVPTTICSPQPRSFVPLRPKCAPQQLLAPSLLLARKRERWGRERFPQLCAEMLECVKRQSLSPLQPTSCCCHKSGERRGAGSVGGTL